MVNIYFITCFERLELNERGWPDNGYQRTFGYFANKDIAISEVMENRCDLHECLYMFALVEYIPEGIHQSGSSKERWFFKYNEKTCKFESIKEPDGYEVFSNFGL